MLCGCNGMGQGMQGGRVDGHHLLDLNEKVGGVQR